MIELKGVTKVYEHNVKALDNFSIKIDKGEFVFLAGPSGSGKSTFLKLLLKEELPSDGTVYVNGLNLNTMKEKKVPYIRRKVGSVFQDFRLLYDRTVYDNILLALRVIDASKEEIKVAIPKVLEQVGLKGKEKFYPNSLSGGEQQRVALARALVTKPLIILADEPTGNLDDETAEGIMKLLYEINADGTTVVVVTHDKRIIEKSGKRAVFLNEGKIVSDNKRGGNE
ncbi:MAG: cell division ATP-binding protein FtsE [Clostridia bacterium]|nr:cell division ATP-binding protein FtsE [Clostridia bacterium]